MTTQKVNSASMVAEKKQQFSAVSEQKQLVEDSICRLMSMQNRFKTVFSVIKSETPLADLSDTELSVNELCEELDRVVFNHLAQVWAGIVREEASHV